MDLRTKINNDLKDAMKQGDKTRLKTIRSIRALILEFEKSGSGKELTPEEELKLLTSASKKRKDSIDQFKQAGRDDLVNSEQAELDVLMDYLPKQLSEEEIREEVKRIGAEINAKGKEDFPKLMPAVIKELKGKADGKIIKQEVEKYLEFN